MPSAILPIKQPKLGPAPAKHPGLDVEAAYRLVGMEPLPHQLEVWQQIHEGSSGILHAPTGSGKTMAVALPLLIRALAGVPASSAGLRFLWITPLRALVEDTRAALGRMVQELGLEAKVDSRCGDTASSVKARQLRQLPEVLITTPESLSLLLSHDATQLAMESLSAVVVDEWHEMLSTKRGVQTELCLARLRSWQPSLLTWGLSATLGQLEPALQALMGRQIPGRIVEAKVASPIEIETLIPHKMEIFPWAGHLGQQMVPQVVQALEGAGTSLVFTNVRSQSEWWYQAILKARPDWEGQLGLHHGSLEKADRLEVERRLACGQIRAVVCTSSLDLGVDFSPVDQVIQIGGPKGIARLLQRAGRSGHRPGKTSRILCVPTHAMEMMEFAAAREAVRLSHVETREPLEKPLDVLAQHLITLAIGGGFQEEVQYEEIRSAWSYRNLDRNDWLWVLEFITQGGQSLKAYDQFKKVRCDDGWFQVDRPQVVRWHRMSIGTIASDPSLEVRVIRGKTLGHVEESFLSRLKPGVKFVFGGQLLELVRIRQMRAWVRRARGGKASVSVWSGGYAPLSSELAAEMRRTMGEVSSRCANWSEIRALEPMLRAQTQGSVLPSTNQCLIERVPTRQGIGWFLYPFAGRLAHEGLAALIAHRISQESSVTLSMTCNDYGLHLLSEQNEAWDLQAWKRWLDPHNLVADLEAALHTVEMDRRVFRDVARVAGLIHQGFPGARKPVRQLQVSSELLFEVFQRYDPGNLLIEQTHREVLSRELDVERLQRVLEQMAQQEWIMPSLEKLSPMAFPLWAESQRRHVSNESWVDRIRRESIRREDDLDPQ